MWFWKFLDSFTGFGKSAVFFDSTLIKIDVQALTEFYMTNGFFDAKVTCTYKVDTASAIADLLYIINEGKPSKFGSLNLMGLISIPGNTYKNIEENISIDSTIRFSQGLVQENVNKIVSNLQNNGYMNVSFDSTIVYKDTMRSKADMSIFFTPGDVYLIKDVKVNKEGEGAPYVESEMLKDMIDVKAGDLYSFDKIRRSQTRLSRTGIFSSVNFKGDTTNMSLQKIPIDLTVRIDKMNELSPEFIANNQNYVFMTGFGATYARKNFLGRARKFTVTGSVGIQDIFNTNFKYLKNNFDHYDNTSFGYADARMILEQPYLLNEPIFGVLETYWTLTKRPSYNVIKYGGKLSFEFEMPPYTYVNYLTTYYNLEVNNTYTKIQNDYNSKSVNLSLLGFELKSLKSNDPIFPTGGNNTSLLMEEANFLSYLTAKLGKREFTGSMFYKILASTAFYFPLNSIQNTVFGIKFKSGFINAYNGISEEIPIDRKLGVGGPNSLRAWSDSDTTTNSINPLEINNGTTIVTKGNFLFEGSAELRFRFLTDLGANIFLDWGRSWTDYSKFRFDDIALGIGFGLKYYTSFAAFRFDVGIKTYIPTLTDGSSKWLFDRSFNRSFWHPDNFGFQVGIGEAF